MLINYFLGCTESTKSMFFLKEGGLQATRSQRVKHNCSDLAHTHITFVFQICFHNICFPDYQNYKTKVYKVIKITFPKSLAIIHKLSNVEIQRKKVFIISIC